MIVFDLRVQSVICLSTDFPGNDPLRSVRFLFTCFHHVHATLLIFVSRSPYRFHVPIFGKPSVACYSMYSPRLLYSSFTFYGEHMEMWKEYGHNIGM